MKADDEQMDRFEKRPLRKVKAQQCTTPYFPVWSQEEDGAFIGIPSGSPGYEGRQRSHTWKPELTAPAERGLGCLVLQFWDQQMQQKSHMLEIELLRLLPGTASLSS